MNTLRDAVGELLEDSELMQLDEYLDTGASRQADTATARSTWPAPLDLGALLSKPAEPPRMIIPDWLPAGYATLLAGHGGAGKSSIALRLAVCIALGRPWLGLECEQRPVLYLSAEDRETILHWRLQRICDAESLTSRERDALSSALNVVDLVGHDAMLYQRYPHGASVAPSFTELERLMRDTGAKALFVDGVADTYGASENDRGDVKRYVNALVQLVGIDGAAVLVHHVNRPTAAASTSNEGYSGSTGWHNSVRARWYLYPEIEISDDGASPTGALVLALQKSNLGRDDQSIRLRWDDDAHLFIAEAGASRFDKKVRDTAEQRGIVDAFRAALAAGQYVPAATTGSRTAFHVLKAFELPATLSDSRAGRRRFWAHIEKLRAIGTLRESGITRDDRHKVATLALNDAPDKDCGHAGHE